VGYLLRMGAPEGCGELPMGEVMLD
jgi:hypothetical protein